MIEANLLRVAAELPVEPVGSRPERMPDGSIAADDHRVLQQLVRVLEHAMKKSDDEELRLIAKTYTASYPNAQQAIAHLFTQRLPLDITLELVLSPKGLQRWLSAELGVLWLVCLVRRGP